MLILHIALPIVFDKIFDYLCPGNVHIMVGARVIVPFREKKVIGIVVSISEKSIISFHKLKEIYQVLDHCSIFSPPLWYVLLWASKYYQFPLGKILFHIIPQLLKKNTDLKFTCGTKNLPYKINESILKKKMH